MRNTVLHSLLTIILLAYSSPADAATVKRSGNTYYKQLCAPVLRGQMTCDVKVVTDRAGHPVTSQPRHYAVMPQGYGPSDLVSAYKLNTYVPSSRVAIVVPYGYPNAEKYLSKYRAEFGLPTCTIANGCFRKMNQYGGQKKFPKNDPDWAELAALELDMVSATCPNCFIDLIEPKTPYWSDLNAAIKTAVTKGAHVISFAIGGVEDISELSEEAHFNHPGVAIVAMAGDNGYGINYPASSAYTTAVGGTTLAKGGGSRGWSEAVWPDTGSGCSEYIAKPSWQRDSGCSKRTDNDTAAVADPNTGVAVYAPSGDGSGPAWQVYGGTSAATAIIAGVYGLNGGTVNAASTLYQNYPLLYDISSGSNSRLGCPPNAYLCTAGQGYDGPSGLGTPNTAEAFGTLTPHSN